MSRKRTKIKRDKIVDIRYNNELVAYAIRMMMLGGKKTKAENIVYAALEKAAEKAGKDPLDVFTTAIDNIKPRLEVKSRRVGGATYQVPIEVSDKRAETLALRWIRQYSRGRKGQSMVDAFASELLDAYNNQGSAIKKRDDTHKMAQANKAFAHYRW